MIETPIYLASKSPRRAQLLKESAFQLELLSIQVEEVYPSDLPTSSVASYLAELKAEAAQKQFPEYAPILTADSIVIIDDLILEKPNNEEEAISMLQKLSGREHYVDTGFCILSKQQKHLESVRTKVFMSKLSEKEIKYYVQEFNPYDKAGAYGIQEWIGHCKINKIEGSYTNVMGLPMKQVYDAFRQMGF